jgi:uncharacterized membrane protein
MPQAATKKGTKSRAPKRPAAKAKAKPKRGAAKRPPQSPAKRSAAKPAGATATVKPVLASAWSGGRRLAGRVARRTLPVAGSAAAALVNRARRSGGLDSRLGRLRELPIQRSIDVAVPLEAAWEEWMQFDFLPEGTHHVADVERDGDDRLVGHVHGRHLNGAWHAEILDEREHESFAWRSMSGSDCAGLATFHQLGDRLTRIELHLDVVPGGLSDALALVVRLADRRAEADLRRFKAHVEALDPDEYPHNGEPEHEEAADTIDQE